MAKPAKTGNGFDPDLTAQFVTRIEALYTERDQKHSEFMNEAKNILWEVAECYAMAKEKGIPKKELKAVVKTRALQRKLVAVRDNLEAEEQEQFDLIRHSLGDLAELPLGAAALHSARGMPGAEAAA